MFPTPPPFRQHWVYDDPSGVPEPTPYPKAWRPRERRRTPQVVVRRRVRVAHREG